MFKADESAFRPCALVETLGKAQYRLEPTGNSNSFRRSSSTYSVTSYEHIETICW
ncbi:hypothetical protein K435DRAFT_775885 [Dendrothele bispora CBS 962.96]|uniref:Uncharacterized protein n=1 Tax=Dendrothele bispora (strain CBS 962.96) TaxID=1314807 RepID=A0A4S8MHR8_DENBC|nr:hypothetical protein K435DRAFT_775885 [Dendrothele bispora CBS 962.96]